MDFEEGIYRYRLQGTVLAERVPLPTSLSSSDAGASFHYELPSNYAEIHLGIYNGENYSKTDVNDQKAFQFRGSIRPFATRVPALHGLRAHFFVDADHYIKNDQRKRVLGAITFEHTFLNTGFDYLRANDQTLRTEPNIRGSGYSWWATPRLPRDDRSSWEALLDTITGRPTRHETPLPRQPHPFPASPPSMIKSRIA